LRSRLIQRNFLKKFTIFTKIYWFNTTII
jgi:hypothetical protein